MPIARTLLLTGVVAAALAVSAVSWRSPVFAQSAGAWSTTFPVDADELGPTGRNPYVVLEPGYTLTLADGADQLVVRVLDETKVAAGVTTRVVEERETHNGVPVEVSRNYFAISRRSNSVYYFGEDVDEYKNGRIAAHGGSWTAGVNGATFGLMMPGDVLLGSRYYQEQAPRVAMDRAEIVSTSETLRTPAGTFTNCLEVLETSAIETGVKEYKYYARGIGLIKDDTMLLTKYGMAQ